MDLSSVENKRAALLYFYHDGCGPCRTLRPKVEQLLQEEFPNMELVLVNGPEQRLLAAQFNVFAHPTLIGFFEGKEFFRKSKYVSVQELREAIQRPYALAFD